MKDEPVRAVYAGNLHTWKESQESKAILSYRGGTGGHSRLIVIRLQQYTLQINE